MNVWVHGPLQFGSGVPGPERRTRWAGVAAGAFIRTAESGDAGDRRPFRLGAAESVTSPSSMPRDGGCVTCCEAGCTRVSHTARWEGATTRASPVASGVYFTRLEWEGGVASQPAWLSVERGGRPARTSGGGSAGRSAPVAPGTGRPRLGGALLESDQAHGIFLTLARQPHRSRPRWERASARPWFPSHAAPSWPAPIHRRPAGGSGARRHRRRRPGAGPALLNWN